MKKAEQPASAFSFEKLIDPITPEDFLKNYWDKDHLVIKRQDPDYYGSLFNIADIDRCIFSARQTSGDNLNIIAPAGSDRKMGRFLPGSLSMDAVYKAVTSGDTVRLMGMQSTWPPIAILTNSLGAALSANVNVNFYMTPAQSQGFPIHIDTHDVFIIQVAGSKNWSIYDPDYELPVHTLQNHSDDMSKKFKSPLEEDEVNLREEVRLETGDMLFMPRGFPHKAATSGEPSLHLTVGVHPLYWIDYARAAIEKLCLDNQEFRHSLPPGYLADPELREEMPKKLSMMMQAGLQDLDFTDTLENMTQKELAKRFFPPDGHLQRLFELDQLTPESVVTRRAGLDCMVARNEDKAEITFSKNTVSGPAAILPILQWVARTPTWRIEDMPGFPDDKSKLILTKRLIREGLLRQVSDQEAAELGVPAAEAVLA